jgi:hypothetical protein
MLPDGYQSIDSLKPLRLVALLASSVVFGLTVSHVQMSPGSRTLDGPM